ncbi:hypothetical protein MRX96_044448 [Rhipicephalus microplus]
MNATISHGKVNVKIVNCVVAPNTWPKGEDVDILADDHYEQNRGYYLWMGKEVAKMLLVEHQARSSLQSKTGVVVDLTSACQAQDVEGISESRRGTSPPSEPPVAASKRPAKSGAGKKSSKGNLRQAGKPQKRARNTETASGDCQTQDVEGMLVSRRGTSPPSEPTVPASKRPAKSGAGKKSSKGNLRQAGKPQKRARNTETASGDCQTQDVEGMSVSRCGTSPPSEPPVPASKRPAKSGAGKQSSKGNLRQAGKPQKRARNTETASGDCQMQDVEGMSVSRRGTSPPSEPPVPAPKRPAKSGAGNQSSKGNSRQAAKPQNGDHNTETASGDCQMQDVEGMSESQRGTSPPSEPPVPALKRPAKSGAGNQSSKGNSRQAAKPQNGDHNTETASGDCQMQDVEGMSESQRGTSPPSEPLVPALKRPAKSGTGKQSSKGNSRQAGKPQNGDHNTETASGDCQTQDVQGMSESQRGTSPPSEPPVPALKRPAKSGAGNQSSKGNSRQAAKPQNGDHNTETASGDCQMQDVEGMSESQRGTSPPSEPPVPALKRPAKSGAGNQSSKGNSRQAAKPQNGDHNTETASGDCQMQDVEGMSVSRRGTSPPSEPPVPALKRPSKRGAGKQSSKGNLRQAGKPQNGDHNSKTASAAGTKQPNRSGFNKIPFRCYQCFKVLSSEHSLKDHIQLEHNGEWRLTHSNASETASTSATRSSANTPEIDDVPGPGSSAAPLVISDSEPEA